MGPGSADRLRYEMASIQMNWAYLNALHGSYREARNLVDSALAVFRRFGQRQREGSALSVSGEAFRYEGKLARAWAEYQKAEELFHELKSWPWLGVIYQEQAICLHQAEREKTPSSRTRRSAPETSSSRPWTSAETHRAETTRRR